MKTTESREEQLLEELAKIQKAKLTAQQLQARCNTVHGNVATAKTRLADALLRFEKYKNLRDTVARPAYERHFPLLEVFLVGDPNNDWSPNPYANERIFSDWFNLKHVEHLISTFPVAYEAPLREQRATAEAELAAFSSENPNLRPEV
jgi:hypothetical protein